MSTFFDKVAEFHDTSGIPEPPDPMLEDEDAFMLTLNLIREETVEMIDAWESNDIVGYADAVADLTYVVLRAGYLAGLPMNEIFDEVHRSNMTKFPDGQVTRREDGKVLKPDTWEPPKIEEIINEAR